MTNDYGNLELHKVLLSALKDFNAFCKEHNLRYILHGGTCLGAIRHKGFIPWDDDVDIAMPRKDYEKFIKLSSIFEKDKYKVLTYRNSPKMITNVMKIEINNSGFGNKNNETGAFLDIFPFSDVPNSKFLQKIQNKLAIFMNCCVYAKMGEITLNSFKSKLIFGFFKIFPRRFLSGMLEMIIKYFPHKNSKYVDIVATANYNSNTGYAWDLIPKAYFENVELTSFETEQFYITRYWEEYLTTHYGDYMKEPPEDKRINKHNITRKD